ncbi:MAG: EthD domain-containing protein, partial [Novosphingobium sp.]
MAEPGPAAGPIKLVILPRTLTGLGRARLRHHLATVHGPMVMAEPAVSKGFRGYVHHYAIACPVQPALEDRDAVTVIRFDALADMIASKASDAYRERIGPDEDNFREVEGSVAMFAQERVIASGADDAPRKLFVFRTGGGGDLDKWAATLSAINVMPGVRGVITNFTQVIEGQWNFDRFDEIGLDHDADIPTLATALLALGTAGEAGFLLSEPLRFIFS